MKNMIAAVEVGALVLAGSSLPAIAQDCNGNGMGDAFEIGSGRGFDDDGNGVLDECSSASPWPRVRMMSIFAGLSISSGTTTWDTRNGVNFYSLFFSRSGWTGWVNGVYGDDTAEITLRPGITQLYFSMQRDGIGGESAASLWFTQSVAPSITVTSGHPAPAYSGTINSPYSFNWTAGAGTASVQVGAWLVRVTSYSGLGLAGDTVGYNGLGPNGAADYSASMTIQVDPVADGDGDGIPDANDNCPSDFNPTQSDCDQNGIGDSCQAEFQDFNGNGVPDYCECIADLFVDGQVNGADLGVLLFQWGPATATTVSDLNRNGQVSGADLGYLLSVWGPCN